MKNKFLAFLFAAVLIGGFVCGVSAESVTHYDDCPYPLVVDDAGLLSRYEEEELTDILADIRHDHGVDVVIVTVNYLNGKSPRSFADDYYDYNGYAKDGMLLLVSMEASDWYVSTTGYCITAVTDAGLDYMSERFVPYMSDGDFYSAFVTFTDLCDEFLTKAESGDPYDIHNLPKEPFAIVFALAVSLVLGFVVALVSTLIMKGKLKTVRSKYTANDYLKEGSFDLTRSDDLFLYRDLKCVPRPKADDNGDSFGGGSSTHFSSSGVSHGGGGGKF